MKEATTQRSGPTCSFIIHSPWLIHALSDWGRPGASGIRSSSGSTQSPAASPTVIDHHPHSSPADRALPRPAYISDRTQSPSVSDLKSSMYILFSFRSFRFFTDMLLFLSVFRSTLHFLARARSDSSPAATAHIHLRPRPLQPTPFTPQSTFSSLPRSFSRPLPDLNIGASVLFLVILSFLSLFLSLTHRFSPSFFFSTLRY